MLPEHFYFTSAAWFGYFFYVPVILFVTGLLYWFLLRRIPLLVVRWSIMIVLLLVLITWPFWEALDISYKAEKLCKEKGGLHVYKTVETDGFFGGGSIQYWSKYGFSYVENVGLGGKYYRQSIHNGEKIEEEIDEFTSHYQTQVGIDSKKIGENFRISSSRVIDLRNGEVLGELKVIKIYPSRFDLIILNLLPVEYNPWLCGEEAPEGEGEYSPAHKGRLYSVADVVRMTLIPKELKGSESGEKDSQKKD